MAKFICINMYEEFISLNVISNNTKVILAMEQCIRTIQFILAL